MALAIIAVVAMVFPDPAARLCISPDSHIAIELTDSDCCGSRDISFTAEEDCQDHPDTAGDCGCCTDVSIVAFGPETIEASQCATGIPALENQGLLAETDFSAPLSVRHQGAYRALGQTSSSLPLLC